MLRTVFARKEPTRDATTLKLGLKNKMDTVIYRDDSCQERMAVWPWHHNDCPDRRFKQITLNCWRWRLQWLAPLHTEAR